ncbi:MAG TPA: hypothetical protein VI386_19710 [Candidatus Sulfotelmatobacter sp.]
MHWKFYVETIDAQQWLHEAIVAAGVGICAELHFKGYNISVADPGRQNGSPHRRPHSIYATETVGLVVIAFLLLVLTLVRYWHHINWSWR